jgi:mRNA interferase RelE/StbE
MIYGIKMKPAALRELKRLPEDVRRRITIRIASLADNPWPQGVEKIQGEEDTYRLRIGDYRVLYQVYRKDLIVLVVRVRHRREVYRT